MKKTTSTSWMQNRVGVLLVLVALTLTASFAGCVTEQPSNGSASTTNLVNVTHTYYYAYNNTPYLTGIIKNTGTQNLVDISLEAEGYTNNTTYERGYASPETGVNSTILPGATAAFMIEMLPVASSGATSIHLNQVVVASANLNTTALTRNITSNNSKIKKSTQQGKKFNLSYRILPPDYKISNENPYPLAIADYKINARNKTISSVSGEVYNGGTTNVNSSVAAVALYSKDGNVLGVFLGKSQGQFAPEKTAVFQIDIAHNFSISLTGVARVEVYAYESPS